MYSKKINQLATNLNPQSTDLIPVGDAITGQLKTTTFGEISGITGDGVISGGVVTWTGTGLVFNISACTYILNGIRYTSPASTKTLSASDPTNDRIDVFAVNTSGQVVVIQGTPSANPVEPQVNVDTQLALTNVTITAGSTTPTQVVVNTIYDENYLYTTEWAMGLSQGTTGSYTIDGAYTGYTAYKGTYSYRTTKSFAGFVSLRWEKNTPTEYNVADYTNLSLAIRITNAIQGADYIKIWFLELSNSVITNKITLSSLYNFNPNLLNTWQLVTIPIADFKFLRTKLAKIVLYWNQPSVANSAIGYDVIQLQGGISNQTNTPVSFGFVQTSSGSASSTIPSDTLTITSSGLTTLSATGKTLSISTPSPIPSQTGNNGKYLTTNGSALSWGTISGMSIGGSITSATQGSVLFAGASGVLAQDNTNFFWDDTNNRLGLGNASPSYTLDITGTLRTTSTINSEGTLNISKSGGTPRLEIQNQTASSTNKIEAVWIGPTGSGYGAIQKFTASTTAYKIIAGSDFAMYNYLTYGDIAILNDNSTGKIKFASGGVSTAQMTLTAAGRLLLGTISESTFILDVNGTGKFNGAINSQLASAGSAFNLYRAGSTSVVALALNVTALNNIEWNTGNAIQTFLSSSSTRLIIRGGTSSDRVKSSGGTVSGSADVQTSDGTFGALTAAPTGSVINYGFSVQQSNASHRLMLGIDASNRGVIALGNSDLRFHQTNIESDLIYINATTGNVIIETIAGTSSAIASAKLAVNSTTTGFLPPRMTTTQKNAIATPAAGLIVFDTTLAKLCVYSGSAWQTITSV